RVGAYRARAGRSQLQQDPAMRRPGYPGPRRNYLAVSGSGTAAGFGSEAAGAGLGVVAAFGADEGLAAGFVAGLAASPLGADFAALPFVAGTGASACSAAPLVAAAGASASTVGVSASTVGSGALSSVTA